ncbi:Aldo/keto reductase [Amylostereum chailletii]|nr:Aldo/keto reductase [Amylostereum chailletii]
MSNTAIVRKIGDVPVPSIGFGAMSVSGSFYGGAVESDEERYKLLDAAYESGCTHWDTANMYNDSEELIGKWFKRTGNRNKIFLATKCGFQRTPDGAIVNCKPEYIKACCEESLNRLGVDTIDLYYLHRADKTVPIEHSVGALVELLKQGKIKYLGLSEVSEATLRRAHAVHPIAALQIEYSPFVLDVEREDIGLWKACRELGIAIVAYSPLGRGLLTGRYKGPEDFAQDDARRYFPKFSKENFPNILQLVDKLNTIGERHGATSGQITLAWLVAQGNNIYPIPGTRSVQYLKENAGAMHVKLSPEEVKEIRVLVEGCELKGGRTPVAYEGVNLADTPPL